jgi:ABC-type nitrate/sulfonate/bicarbonate transport system substrate-binding protein
MKTAWVLTFVCAVLFSSNAHAQKDLTPIKIAYAAPTVDNVLIAIAESQGLFEKNGLKAELIGMRGGVQVIQGVLSGSADFGQGGGAETIQAVVSGIDVALIAGLIPRMHYLLVTRPEISKPADLAGKKFAVASLVGTVIIVARRSLENLGVPPGRVTFLVAGPPQDRVLAVASGNMDATVVAPESLAAVKKSGLKVLKDLSEIPEPIQLTALLTMRKTIREKRPLTKSFLAAIQDAIVFYRSREKESIEVIEKFTGVKDQESLKASYAFHKNLFPLPPYPSKEGIQTLINQLAIDDPKVKGAIANNFFDSSLLEELKTK